MDIEHFRAYCISKKGVTEEFPFDESTLVFKVVGKMFALTDVDDFKSVNLKCEPEKAIELRERHSAIKSGYHMNKKHWNTIEMDGTIPNKLIEQWIDDSYELVTYKLTKKEKELLNTL